MAAGKVFDGTAFYDSIAFNDLWTRVTTPDTASRHHYPSGIRRDPRLAGQRSPAQAPPPRYVDLDRNLLRGETAISGRFERRFAW
jgi:hypothetical protein